MAIRIKFLWLTKLFNINIPVINSEMKSLFTGLTQVKVLNTLLCLSPTPRECEKICQTNIYWKNKFADKVASSES